eukprot:COSAG05_NODE_34_length_27784_cov_62.890129_7_plen_81_part_00
MHSYGLIGICVTILEADLKLSTSNTCDAIRAATAAAVTAAVSSESAEARLMEPIMALVTKVSESYVGAVSSIVPCITRRC